MPTYGNTVWDDLKFRFKHGDTLMKLLFWNIGIYVVMMLYFLAVWAMGGVAEYFLPIYKQLAIPADLLALAKRPWTLLTYQFMHSFSSPWHVLFNMLWLYWFGRIFISYLGSKKLLPIYLLGGLAGAALYLLSFSLLPVFKEQLPFSYMVGASASVTAVMVATAVMFPYHSIRLLIFGNVRIIYIAIFVFIIDIAAVPGGNSGGHIAHIGGAIFGAIYGWQLQQKGNDIGAWLNNFLDWLVTQWGKLTYGIKNIGKPRTRARVVHKDTSRVKTKSNKAPAADEIQEKVDAILDKIARSGYDSLTKQEKDFLFEYSKK